jgi:hypothetical protein
MAARPAELNSMWEAIAPMLRACHRRQSDLLQKWHMLPPVATVPIMMTGILIAAISGSNSLDDKRMMPLAE